jgi:hypothetical protein
MYVDWVKSSPQVAFRCTMGTRQSAYTIPSYLPILTRETQADEPVDKTFMTRMREFALSRIRARLTSDVVELAGSYDIGTAIYPSHAQLMDVYPWFCSVMMCSYDEWHYLCTTGIVT